MLSSYLSDVRWPCRMAPYMGSRIDIKIYSAIPAAGWDGSQALASLETMTSRQWLIEAFGVGAGRSSGRPSGFRAEQRRGWGVVEIKA